MIDVRPVLHVVGRLLLMAAAAMLVPAVADAAAADSEWTVFVASSGLTLFVGLALTLGMRGPRRTLSIRQTVLATALGWMIPAAFSSLPFIFGKTHLSLIDGLFEAIAGATTTSATVLANLDRLPPGLLLWRGLLQWMGGMGVLVMALAILPLLRIGGMQLFRTEMRSPLEKATARTNHIGGTLAVAYGGLTLALVLALWLAGMPGFEAWIHAMTTISTGGFSTWDTSIAHYDRARIEMVITVGMILGGMPFVMLFHLCRGSWRTVWKDRQLRWYLGILAAGSAAVALWMMIVGHSEPATAIRFATFTVVSVMTGTGFTAVDYSGWSGLPAALLLFIAFLGGCAGSTAGGIKVFRLQMLLADALVQMRRLRRPHAVVITKFNGRPIPDEILEGVTAFLVVYAMVFAGLALGLGLLGLDFLSAVSAAAGAVGNLGPGLGPVVGPAGSYAVLPDAAKVLLAAGMLLGRLELFPLLVLFAPIFWRE